MPGGEPVESSGAKIPQGGDLGAGLNKTVLPPPAQQSETISVAKPDTFIPAESPATPLITTADNSSGLTSQETKPTLPDAEWQRILDLGKKSFLDLKPEEIVELQNLTSRGKELLGSDFNNQLEQKKIEALRRKNEQEVTRANQVSEKIEKIINGAKEKMNAIKQEFTARQQKGEEDLRSKEAEFRQNIGKADAKTPEQRLQEVLKDPKMASVKADLDWMKLLAGTHIEGVDPKLLEKIKTLGQTATTRIFTDSQGYQKEFDGLKAEFYQSRGIDLQN